MGIALPSLPGMILPGYPTVAELFEIIYEDGELLVVNKPAGLNTHAPSPR